MDYKNAKVKKVDAPIVEVRFRNGDDLLEAYSKLTKLILDEYPDDARNTPTVRREFMLKQKVRWEQLLARFGIAKIEA